MVSKEHITKSFDYAIQKCHDYPKAVALRTFSEKTWESETYDGNVNTEDLPSPVGRLQQIQADLQEQVEYESLEKGALHDYSTDSFILVNPYLYGVSDWMDAVDFMGGVYINEKGEAVLAILDETLDNGRGGWADATVPQEIELLDSAIEKSPRVAENSIVYRFGELPTGIKEGEHGVFKGFTSTSYNEWVAFDDIAEGGMWIDNRADRYKMRIFTPSGTKGVVLNRHTGCMDWQSELLLGRNQKYVVLNINNDDMTADILLY